jgi:hypothetical protein
MFTWVVPARRLGFIVYHPGLPIAGTSLGRMVVRLAIPVRTRRHVEAISVSKHS